MSGEHAVFVPPARVAGDVLDALGGAEIPAWLTDGYRFSRGSSAAGPLLVMACLHCRVTFAQPVGVALSARARLDLRNHALTHGSRRDE